MTPAQRYKLETIREMQADLRKRGYDIGHARVLHEEGMGPEELRGRLAIPSGKVGSLEYTHRISKIAKVAMRRR